MNNADSTVAASGTSTKSNRGDGIAAKDIMSTDVFCVRPDHNLSYLEIMAELKSIRHVPVVDTDRKLVGIISARDLLEHFSAGGGSHLMQAREIMTRNVLTASSETPITEVGALMRENDLSAVPIIDYGQVVGIVTERDFLKILQIA